MKTSLYHLQINISDPQKSFPFWKDLFTYLKYKIVDESPEHIGASNGTTDFWLIATEEKHKAAPFHRKQTGLNHLAFKASSKEEVDQFVNEFLKPKGIQPLYETPKEFPEYHTGYYAVFFEDPDRIKIEVVYIPQ
jgi:catechol 2,3-dioxygenase-like lactoylglutathione lyase family enzyme